MSETSTTAADPAPLLSIRGLRVSFSGPERRLPAVDGVDLELFANETLCLVGESGCGKSVTAMSVLRLLPDGVAHYEGGEILFGGRDILRLDEKELYGLRGARVAIIFQEPMSALNPVMSVGKQIVEAIRLHQPLDKRAAKARAIELLKQVGISGAERRFSSYPHQLSGGMRQRVMIAMAISCSPAVLIADEPTTALDVTIQAQIIALLAKLQRKTAMSVLLITHDLGLVAEIADRVAVMYAGQIVETAPVHQLFAAPQHPYTRGLIDCIPSRSVGRERLTTIPGTVPPPAAWDQGCRFRDRCSRAIERCGAERPPLERQSGTDEGHLAGCFNPLGSDGLEEA